MTQSHLVKSLYPLYKRYLDEELIPRARRNPDLYGPPASNEATDKVVRASLKLINGNPHDLDELSVEVLAGLTWMANKTISMVLENGDAYGSIQGESDEDLLRAFLKAVWPSSIAIHLAPSPTLH